MIHIQEVKNKKDKRNFINFPWTLYKDDSHWVPPIRMDIKKLLNPLKHPFYDYGTVQLFLAYKNGEIVGRIAAITNSRYDEYHPKEGGTTGFFGFFECINDQEVANKLLDTAKAYLVEKGCVAMQGPASPSSNYEFGVLSEGFDDMPRVMMAYNPAYYVELLENYGLPLVKTLYAYKIDGEKALSNPKLKRGVDLVKRRYDVEIRHLDMKNLKEEVAKVKYLYNNAWESNWGHVPFTDKEIDAVADELKMTAEPSLMPFIYVGGELAGLAMATLDFNVLLKKINGRLFPFGIFTLLTQKKKIKWARVIVLGLLPKFRGKGLDAPLYYELIENARKLGIDYAEGSWILEDNDAMNRGMRVVSGEVYKKYRVYELAL